MGRGQTTEEFAAENGPNWMYAGGVPGDPGIVTEAARKFGDEYGLDAQALDDTASAHGWEFHDQGYDGKIEQLARDARAGLIELELWVWPPLMKP